MATLVSNMVATPLMGLKQMRIVRLKVAALLQPQESNLILLLVNVREVLEMGLCGAMMTVMHVMHRRELIEIIESDLMFATALTLGALEMLKLITTQAYKQLI